MYIKNRQKSIKIKAFGSGQTLYLTESLSLSTALLSIHRTLYAIPPVSREKLTSQANVKEVDFREKTLSFNRVIIRHLQKS